MRPEVLIDTNVIRVANGRHGNASPSCVIACLDALESALAGEVILLDSLGHILAEYLLDKPFTFPQGVGDQFVVEVVLKQGVPDRCQKVAIVEHADRGFVEFPADAALTGFDRSDRKFVAVAIARGGRPPILNATDSDWTQFGAALKPHVDVVELCPDQLKTVSP